MTKPLALVANSFLSQPTGVKFQLTSAPNFEALNLYDGVDDPVDLPDLTLIGASNGPVVGSLMWHPSSQSFEFLKTGGPLLPDTYTLTFLVALTDG